MRERVHSRGPVASARRRVGIGSAARPVETTLTSSVDVTTEAPLVHLRTSYAVSRRDFAPTVDAVRGLGLSHAKPGPQQDDLHADHYLQYAAAQGDAESAALLADRARLDAARRSDGRPPLPLAHRLFRRAEAARLGDAPSREKLREELPPHLADRYGDRIVPPEPPTSSASPAQ